jgi:hypothetical protein
MGYSAEISDTYYIITYREQLHFICISGKYTRTVTFLTAKTA